MNVRRRDDRRRGELANEQLGSGQSAGHVDVRGFDQRDVRDADAVVGHGLTVAGQTLSEIGLAGYRQAVSDHGVRVSDVALIEAANIDMPSGLAAAELLIREFAPTAIVATSDVHAVAALKALSSNGIAVPEAVSVIGFDDAPIADLVGLTTIRQPLRDKGRTAAKILLDLIAGQSRRRSIMATELIVRSTTGPAPGSP